VRSYGLSAPTARGALAACREPLGQGSREAPLQLDWQTACSQQGVAHPERCPGCGQPLVCRGTIPRLRMSPPARARDGRGMSHQPGVGPGWRREESALTPRQSWPGHTQGSDGGLELTRSSPPHRLLDALSCGRRVLARGLRWDQVQRTEVPHSVRGSSNHALKLQRVARGCISVSVPLQLNANTLI